MAGLYFISFAVILISIVIWLHLHYREVKSDWLFIPVIGGLLVYSFTVFGGTTELSAKLWFVFRDFLILGVVALVFNKAKKNLIYQLFTLCRLIIWFKNDLQLGFI